MLTIYKASAGSGKTYQLTLHYIRNLLGVKVDDEYSDDGYHWELNPALKRGEHPYSHRQILAITFTNKATEEMKSRIITSLDDIALGKHEKYITKLTEEFGCSRSELAMAARRALTSMLLDYKFFNVSTIDSFFQSILRSFAYELDVQGDYDVELGEENSIKDGLNELLEQVNYRRHSKRRRSSRGTDDGRDGQILDRIDKWLRSLIFKTLQNESKSYNPFQREHSLYRTLVKQVGQIFKEDFKSREDEMKRYLIERDGALERFREALDARFETIDSEGNAVAKEIESVLDRHGLTVENLHGNNFRKQIKGLLDTPPVWPAVSATMEKIINGKESAVKMVTNPPKSLSDDDADLEVLRLGLVRLAGLVRQRSLVDIVGEGLIYLEFIGYMLRIMSAVNDSKNRVVLGDTNRLIHQIIRGTDTPFIYERIGVFLKNFLIDEFQDTSRMQWQNLFPLVKNALDENNDSLIIGDTKQAIYRFRNSDSSMLGDTLFNQDFHGDRNIAKVLGTTVAENTNYRTSETIVKFNNTFFPQFAQEVGQNAGYVGGEVMQMSPDEKKSDCFPGYIRLEPYSEKDYPGGARVIVEEIKAAHNRGYDYKQIAVLVRRNNDPQEIIDLLIQEGLPVQSKDCLFISSARSVKMLVSLLYSFERMGHDPKEDDPKRRMTYDDTLYVMSRVEYLMAENQQMGAGEAIDTAIRHFENSEEYGPQSALDAIAKSHPSSLPAVVEAIIAAGLIPHELLRTEKDYLAAFVDFVTEYAEDHDDDLNGFLKRWEIAKKDLSLPPPPTSDAVAVMTVHQAKGLEWPVVFIPKFEWPLTPPTSETKWLTVKDGENSMGEFEEAEFDIAEALGLDIDADDIPPLLKLTVTKKLSGLDETLKTLVDRILSLQSVDILNLAYVGFTRPVSELHVRYFNDPKDVHCGSLLKHTLDAIATRSAEKFDKALEMKLDETVYNAETGELTIGEPTYRTKSEEKTEPSEAAVSKDDAGVDAYESSVRSDAAVIVKVGAIDIEDLEAEVEEDENQEDTVAERIEKAATRGISLHSILEKVIERGDLEAALESTEFENEEQAAGAREILTKAIAHESVAGWFGDSPTVSEVRTEMPVFTPNPLDSFDNGDISRIDRLVFHTDGSIEIVDYKFTTAGKKDDREQVKRYIRLIKQIYQGRKVTGSLWYVDRDKIVKVND